MSGHPSVCVCVHFFQRVTYLCLFRSKLIVFFMGNIDIEMCAFLCFVIADVDECAMEVSVCDKNARCFNVYGSFQCQCLPGYQGDGRTCIRKQ